MIKNTLARLLSEPSHRRRLLLFNLLMLLAICVCFGLFITQQTRSELRQWQRQELNHVELVTNDLRVRLAPLLADVQILAGSPWVLDYLQAPSDVTQQALNARLRATAEHRKLYSQIRLLSQPGHELARVDHRGGLIRVVTAEALQSKAQRYYVLAGQQLQAGQVYLSPLDLNIENGHIEYPLNPTLRVVAPVFLQGELRGLVVINYLASALLESFADNMADIRGEAMLLNREGYWLHAPNSRQRFGFQLDHGASFATTYPDIWASLTQERWGEFQGLTGWFGVSRLDLGEGEQRQHWYVVSHLVPPVFLNAWLEIGLRHRLTLGLVMLLGITGVSVFVLLQLWERESQQQQQEHSLAHRNDYDPLTDLPNRALLVERLWQMLRNAHRHADEVAVISLDVNHFKRINHSLGYAGGDSLLQQLALRLRDSLRADDTLARVAGDRFVILLESAKQEHAIAIVGRKILEAVEQPFRVHGAEVVISCSLGISLYPQDGDTADALLSHAETALHQSRRGAVRQAAYQFYDANLHALSDQKLALENALRQALAHRALALHYQPQLDLRSRRIVAVEALARWHDPVQGVCPPDVFIPLAEESGLIQPLGDWVLTEACEQQCRWEAQGLTLRVAVNLSAQQLIATDLLERVQAIVAHTGVLTHRIELEITESAVMENLQQALNNLWGLRELGFHLAVDDFGTGYSSLSYLHRLPVHYLKIDRSFVEGMGTRADAEPIVRGVIAMAHALRLVVVAEGVETQVQLDRLSVERCDVVQGYFLSKPLIAEDIASFCEGFPERQGGSVVPIR